jgi:ABC-2 type transport system permease protein
VEGRRATRRRAGRLMRVRRMANVYGQYWRINILTTLEYRENFLIWFLFTFIYHGTAIASLWIVLKAFPSMNGWDFRDMAFLYALWMVAHALHNTFFSTVGEIPDHIRDGEFDRLLLRPLDTLFQAIATPGQVFPDELILALVTFVVATVYSGVRVDAIFLIFVPLVAIGGALIDLGLNLIISTAAFWVVKVDALRWIFVQLEQEFTRYPLSIYSRGVRLLLTFVFPFAFMNYFPAAYFLRKGDGAFAFPAAVGLATPLIGVVFVGVAYGFWRFGLNRYQGVGH